MFRYSDAEELVLTFLRLQYGDRAVILHNETITKPYGWVFYYQGRDWVESRRRGGMIGLIQRGRESLVWGDRT